jgi:lipopolysaccharide export system protein LptA
MRLSDFSKKISAIITTMMFVSVCLFAQQQNDSAANSKIIIIIQAQRLNHQTIKDTSYQSLVGNVILKQDKAIFYADSAVINQNANVLQAYGHVHINDNDSVNTYSDYLRYIGNEKKAFLKDSVKLTDGKGTLTTPSLEYDLQTKLGTYLESGKLVDSQTVITSTEGYYYGETRDAIFKKKVVLVNPQYIIKTDTLIYNTYTDSAVFTVPTEITSGPGKKILTSEGYYDAKSKRSYFGKRSVLQDSSSFLIADDEVYNDSTGYGEYRGNVVFRDTAEGITILANDLRTSKKTSAFLATQKPVMIIKQNGDSLFIAADTLYSGKLSQLRKTTNVPLIITDTFAHAPDSLALSQYLIKTDSLNRADSSRDRFFEAYYHVRIYSDSMQAVCDSMFYSGEDSAFRLITAPIVWGKENQITGDTIYLFTENKKPKQMYVFYNAMAISNSGHDFYDQIRGRTINAYFKDGEINFMHSKGTQAESVYYAQDEHNKFIGVNKAMADVIDMYFDNRKPYKVAMRNNVSGTTYPMKQVNHEDLKLKGFKWQQDRRPKSSTDLFSNY